MDEKIHESDRGGDDALWTSHAKGKPHVVVHKEMGSETEEATETTERREVLGVDDPAFYEEEEDDPEEEERWLWRTH